MKIRIKRLTAMILAMAMSMSLLSVNVWAGESSGDGSGSVQSVEGVSAEETPAPEEKSATPEQAKKSELPPVEKRTTPEAEEKDSDTAQKQKVSPKGKRKGTELGTQEIVASGDCGAAGDKVTWTLDSGGTLIISGKGKMKDYTTAWTEQLPGLPWINERSLIREAVIQGGVTHIGSDAFSGCENMTSVTICGSVTSIGDDAFSLCKCIKNITIPDGVTSIEHGTFMGCSNLENVNIPDGVTSIGGGAFEGCDSLTTVNIPDGVTTIGAYAFSGCDKLTTINLPDGITKIDVSTFGACKKLASITIPENVTIIEGHAFAGCSSLTSISIPKNVASIGKAAFVRCSNIKGSIRIPDGVTSVGNETFRECSSLESIFIPESVTSIGDQAFYECSRLNDINIPRKVTSIGKYAFYRCSSLSKIDIPDGVTSIEDVTFRECKNLSHVYIPEGVTSIGSFAFYSCSSLTRIDIPASITDIKHDAFYSGRNLTEIYFYGDAPAIDSQCFSNNKITAFYPANNSSWTDEKKKNYGGRITWKEWNPSSSSHSKETQEKKAIIVVPGVCGSELVSEEVFTYDSVSTRVNKGQRVWLPTYEKMLTKLFAKAVGCNEDGTSLHKLSPVKVDEEKDGSIGTSDSATKLVKLLYNQYDKGKDEQYDVRFFSYDWRMSIRESATGLKQFIDSNKFDKVILVCHSMGGLVASQYIKDGNKDRIEKLITVATPYLGSVKALNVLETGEFVGTIVLKDITKSFFKEATKNYPTVYELMPSNRYMDNRSIVSISTADRNGRYSSYQVLNTSETKKLIQNRHNTQLYKNALSTTDSLFSGRNHPIDLVDSYVIYSTGVNGWWGIPNTIGEVFFKKGRTTKIADIRPTFGDGTVPTYSATLGERTTTGTKKHRIAMVSDKEHAEVVSEITKDTPAWKYITAAINDTWDDTVSLQSQSAEDEDSVQLTKLRLEGDAAYTISDNHGNILATIKDGTLMTAEGYENYFYALDENCSTVLAFLEPNSYQVQVESVTSDDFECDVIEYSDYFEEKKDTVTEYKLSEAVDNVTEKTAAIINTDKKAFQVDSDGDNTYETTGTGTEPVFAESVTINQTKATVQRGKSVQFAAMVMPENVTYPGVSWFSNNKEIATVSENGLVTGVSAGSAVITADVNGVQATAKIQVKGSSLKAPSSFVAKYDKKKKTVTVKWKKNAKGKGYQLEYSTDKKFKKSVNTIKISKNKTVKTTVKKLQKGTWYFRIRTVKGKEHSGWSAVKKVKVSK